MIKLFLSVVLPQPSRAQLLTRKHPKSSTTVPKGTNGMTETTTSTSESFGTVTEFTPGDSLSLQTEAAQPLHYKFGKNVTYVNSHGKVVDASKIRKDSKVRVHYLKHGDDMIVDKVIVTRNRD
jgi:hypothetical protein